MTMEADLRARLIADVTVGGLIGTRVYPAYRTQGDALPAITYSRVFTNRQAHNDGPIGVIGARMQISCWADSYAGARAVAEAVRNSLDGFDGELVAAGTPVQGIMFVEETDTFVASAVDSDVGTHGVLLDFDIWFAELTPTFP